jgi:hypothetical protein
MQSFYADTGTLAEIAIGWRGVIGRGPSLASAITAIRPVRPDQRPSTAAGALDVAREWFRRLDSARAVGDWRAFGEAWDGLRAALQRAPDTAR